MITITVFVLAFFFLASLAFVCILVLQALALNPRLKAGYAAMALTYVLWIWALYNMPAGLAAWWVYALPLVWMVLLFRFGFSGFGKVHQYPTFTGEPRYTEESLRGRAGTREALTFYFLLLLIGLILGLVIFNMTLRFH